MLEYQLHLKVYTIHVLVHLNYVFVQQKLKSENIKVIKLIEIIIIFNNLQMIVSVTKLKSLLTNNKYVYIFFLYI